MSDTEEEIAPFAVEKAKTGRSACKKCKQKLAAGELRMSKVVDNPWGYVISYFLTHFTTVNKGEFAQ